MSKKQKIILIAGLAVLVIAGGVLIYNFLIFKKPKPEVEEVALIAEERKQLVLSEEEKRKGITLEEKEKQIVQSKESDAQRRLSGQEEKKPEVKVVTINKIIDREVKFPVLSADQKKILYFDPKEREFYQAELDGTTLVSVTKGNFSNLENVSWSQDRSKAVLTIFNSEKKDKEYFYFDFAVQESKKIDSRFKNAIISSDGKKIAYIYSESGKNIFNLSVADPDGKNWRKISFLDGSEGKINWLLDGRLIFIPQGSSTHTSGLYVYDVTEGKNSFVFLSGRYSFGASFSPDGKNVLWQAGDKEERRPSLYFSSLSKTKNATKITLNGLAEKCAWFYDNVNILCAIPENFSNYYRQPESWQTGEFVSRDSFYKINTQTGETTRVAEARQFEKDYDASLPFMLQDNKTMYFVRKHDGKLYQLMMP
jgi:hypothetical protein